MSFLIILHARFSMFVDGGDSSADSEQSMQAAGSEAQVASAKGEGRLSVAMEGRGMLMKPRE